MAALTNQLLALIRANPDIFLVRLADLADCDVDAIHVALAEAIARGEILSEKKETPNGYKSPVFRCNPAYLGWKIKPAQAETPRLQSKCAGTIVPEKPVPGDDRASGQSVTPAPVGKKPDTVSPKAARLSAAEAAAQKLDNVIDYLRQHGTASNDDLRRILGITYYPQAALKSAIRNGVLAYQNNIWRLGSREKVARTGVNIDAVHAPAPTTAPSAPTQTALPRPISTGASAPEDAVSSSLQVSGLHIMVWQRSGRMVLSVHDKAVDLSPAQVRALTMFIGLMGTARE